MGCGLIASEVQRWPLQCWGNRCRPQFDRKATTLHRSGFRANSSIEEPTVTQAAVHTTIQHTLPSKARQFHAMAKPRVVRLIVFRALIGLLLAALRLPNWKSVLTATVSIWLVGSAAAAIAPVPHAGDAVRRIGAG
jgi:hypothetical protein